MNTSPGNIASGTLLVIVGVWLLLQTVAGDLPRRLLSLAGTAKPTKSGGGLNLPGIPDLVPNPLNLIPGKGLLDAVT